MIAPEIPENELERIKTLHNLHILDTDAEERFDRITRIAKNLFNVPIVLISLIDSDRQWLKSKQGLNISETPRDISFCGHAILKNETMIVADAQKDIRFSDNPLVVGNPHIRFYLGCPLQINKKHNIGTLCILDKKPREFTQAEQLIMRDLADMIQAELESIHLSTTDELTKLTNRRGFMLIAKHVFNLVTSNPKPLTLLFFDLNKFKQINDEFGHEQGDQVLVTFANCLLDTFIHSDVIARLGGDEFCVLCSDLDKKQLNSLLTKLDKELKNVNKTNHAIHYSVGFVDYNIENHKTLKDMLNEADSNMYENKRKST